jgi:hypothetical protein
MKVVKALSIKQPHAWLEIMGFKPIETRPWKIGKKPGYNGISFELELPARIFIHVPKVPDKEGWDNLCDKHLATPLLQCKPIIDRAADGSDIICDPYEVLMEMEAEDLGIGGIIGEIDIVDCVTESDSQWFHFFNKRYGKYGFVLANPVKFQRIIPCSGALGFFEPSKTVLEQIEKMKSGVT